MLTTIVSPWIASSPSGGTGRIDGTGGRGAGPGLGAREGGPSVGLHSDALHVADPRGGGGGARPDVGVPPFDVEVLAQRVGGVVLRHDDASQVGMTAEVDAHQIVRLAL